MKCIKVPQWIAFTYIFGSFFLSIALWFAMDDAERAWKRGVT